jgi:hypothetical protein
VRAASSSPTPRSATGAPRRSRSPTSTATASLRSWSTSALAGSAFPPLIFRLQSGKLVDVTRAFPKLVRADAATQLKLLRRLRRTDDVRGVLAAYVADEYLLRKASVGLRQAQSLGLPLSRRRRRDRSVNGAAPCPPPDQF